MQRFALFIAAGVMTVGLMVAFTSPAAHAQTPLNADQAFCGLIGGTFTTEVFGGQTNSTCTFTLVDGTHHIRYENGIFADSD